MTDMTTTALPAGSWTLVYTAAGAVTITMQNTTPSCDLLVRIGTAAVVGDPLTSAADRLHPFEHRSGVVLASGDKVFARPEASDRAGSINIRA